MRAFFILKDTVSRNDIQLLSKHNVVFSDTFLSMKMLRSARHLCCEVLILTECISTSRTPSVTHGVSISDRAGAGLGRRPSANDAKLFSE
jgi:hypothetical protein